MRFRLADLAVALLFVAVASPADAQTIVADLPVPSGGTERAAFFAAAQGHATVVLLAGGEGIVMIDNAGNTGNTNFLIRTRMMWLPYGINAVILGSPDGRSLIGQRSQPAYAAALGVAVDFARARGNAPVWLMVPARALLPPPTALRISVAGSLASS